MQLHTAETLLLEVGPGRKGDGPFDAMVKLKVAVVGAGTPAPPDAPEWVRFTVDRSDDWEDAAVTRGHRLRASWR